MKMDRTFILSVFHTGPRVEPITLRYESQWPPTRVFGTLKERRFFFIEMATRVAATAPCDVPCSRSDCSLFGGSLFPVVSIQYSYILK